MQKAPDDWCIVSACLAELYKMLTFSVDVSIEVVNSLGSRAQCLNLDCLLNSVSLWSCHIIWR